MNEGRTELWRDLASAFGAVVGSPESAVRHEVLAWFERAWPYLREDVETMSGAEAVAAIHTMTPFLGEGGDWAALAEVSRRGQDLTPRLDQLGDHLAFTHHLGIALQQLGDAAGAEQAFKEVARRAEAAGNPGLRAKALAHRAQLRRHQGEAGEAVILFHQAVQAYRAVGDVFGEAKTLSDLAPAVAALGDRAGAARYVEHAQGLFQELGAHRAEARATWMLASIRANDEDASSALALYDEAIRLFLSSGAPTDAARSAYQAAHLLAKRDDLPACVRYAELAEELAHEHDDKLHRSVTEVIDYVRTKIAIRHLAEADSDEAADLLIESHPELRTHMGLVLAVRDQPARIRRLAEYPESAARWVVGEEWRMVLELAGESILPDGLETLVQRYVLARPDEKYGLLERIIEVVPAATLPRVRGRYLLFLIRHTADNQSAIRLALEAVALLDAPGTEKLSAEALAEAGMAWRRLRTGDSRRNKDEALSCLRRALRSYHRRTDPDEWSRIVVALANVYAEYPADRRRNLRRAISRFTAALTVLTPQSSPEGHATARAGLGLVLSDPDLADDPQNLETARKHLEHSLEMLDDPVIAAIVLRNLSRCYKKRVLGDPDANHDLALLYAKQSYELCRAMGRPIDAAEAANAVGGLLAESTRRSGPEAWTEVFDWYGRALEALPVEEAPAAHAAALDNLANAISRMPGALEVNFEGIVAARLTAAEIYHDLGDAREWSRALYNLAWTLSEQQPPDHSKVIQLYEESLTGRPVDDAPTEWAESASGLARALSRRDRSGDGERAEELLRRVIAVGVPGKAHEARALLGRLLGRRGDWAGAAEALSNAVADVDTRYLSTMLSAGREAVLTRIAGLPREAAYALARAGRATDAVTLIEGARARELSRLLERDRADLSALEAVAPSAALAFRDAVARLAGAEARQRGASVPDVDERRQLRGLLADAQAQLHAAVEAIQAIPGFGDFANRPDDAPRRAAEAAVPLVYLITAEFGSVALLVEGNGSVEAVFGPLTEDELVDLLSGAKSLIHDRDLLPRLIGRLGERFLGEVAQHLTARGIVEVVMVATGLLGVLPVHAARYRRDSEVRYLLDDVVMSFAPSARSLLAARSTDQRQGDVRLVGVAEPQPSVLEKLPSAVAEVTAVRQLFPGTSRDLTGPAATKSALVRELAGATHVHLACHGSFEIDQPLRSGLFLADDDMLTLRELLDVRPLAGVQLVVASACQSAVSDIAYAPDEATGLPTGLVYAGADTVAGTLWNLSDQVASLLVCRFYTYHFHGEPNAGRGPMSAAQAMTRAQVWLRESTIDEINCFADEAGLPRLQLRLVKVPFANEPAHWAPFVVIGSGAHDVPGKHSRSCG